MSVKASKKPIADSSTQRYLPFSQIRDNLIIMKDSSLRVVLKCSTINFLLKSAEEQDSIIMSFQRFLNSIDFPIQIMVRSTKLDIEAYLNKLKNLALNQTNPLLQNQTYEYIQYLKKLIEVAQIMRKDFYIVVPIDNESDNSVRDLSFMGRFKNFWASINGQDDLLSIKYQIRNLNKNKKLLIGRVNSIRTSLESIGIRAQELDKSQLVKFLGDYYNPTLENYNNVKTNIENYNLI
ncbi:MAG: TraC family protein [Candidatus Gracilibacteria bacterium]|nr:TraC family protein [Candidatus Gracilibacteria bacterium]